MNSGCEVVPPIVVMTVSLKESLNNQLFFELCYVRTYVLYEKPLSIYMSER